MPPGEPEPAGARARLIETVRTPLGFFALVVLVAEAVLGVAATVLRDDVDPAYVLAAMVALIFLLIALVAGFALLRPEALHGRRFARPGPPLAERDPVTELVRAPSVLCASTAGSGAHELDRYAEALSRRFADVTVRRDLDVDALRGALRERKYDVVHLVTQAAAGRDALRVGEREVAGAALRDLLDAGAVRLVVLTACDSLPVASEVARVATVVAAPATAGRGEVAQWSEGFFDQLARGLPVSRAYAAASAASRAPVMLVLTRDVAFTR